MADSDLVYLNVGGIYFLTRRSTLLRSNSFFSGLAKSTETEFFVDRDPSYFRHILNWMRGVRYLPEDDTVLRELTWEADYYCLQDMRDAISRSKRRFSLLQNAAEIATEMRKR